MATECTVIDELDFLPCGRTGETESEVRLDTGHFRFREGKTQDTAMMGRCTFSKNVAFHKTGTVISWPCCFCLLIEFLTIARERTVIASITGLERTYSRHGKKVSELSAPARATETHEREADHGSVMDIVSWRVASLVYGYRTYVYHTIWSAGTRYA